MTINLPPDARTGRKKGRITHNTKTCVIPECLNKSHARGLCTGHWRQWSKGYEFTPLRPHSRVVNGMKVCVSCDRNLPVAAYHKKLGLPTHNCAECINLSLRCKTYGLTRERVTEMLKHGCEVCGTHPENLRNLHIDHCHNSGRVRGLLCTSCNTALGAVKDNIATLRGLAAYVERNQSS